MHQQPHSIKIFSCAVNDASHSRGNHCFHIWQRIYIYIISCYRRQCESIKVDAATRLGLRGHWYCLQRLKIQLQRPAHAINTTWVFVFVFICKCPLDDIIDMIMRYGRFKRSSCGWFRLHDFGIDLGALENIVGINWFIPARAVIRLSKRLHFHSTPSGTLILIVSRVLSGVWNKRDNLWDDCIPTQHKLSKGRGVAFYNSEIISVFQTNGGRVWEKARGRQSSLWVLEYFMEMWEGCKSEIWPR